MKDRLWRCSDPHLDEAVRSRLVAELMAARRAVRDAKGERDGGRREGADRDGQGGADLGADLGMAEARRVDAAKRGLGERGPVWWTDGAPDLNRHLARNTPYADWYGSLPED